MLNAYREDEKVLTISEGFLRSSSPCLHLFFFTRKFVEVGVWLFWSQYFFWGTNEFEVSLEKRIMLIGLLGAEMWSFEVQKFGNFAHLSTFGFFFMNFLGGQMPVGTRKNPFFEKNSFFEGCNGFMIPKMHSWGV